MKKKFFAIYALIGAMAVSPIFTSCVDSEETPSVEALRNAKAEELKAIADLNNAQAASTTALAAAEAALIKAQADAQKAANELKDAQTAMYETQNEAERAQLEVTIKNAEAELARIQGEIDAQAINVQTNLLNAQQQLLHAQAALDDATKDYDEAQKAKLQTLASEYSDAVNGLLQAQQNLVLAKSQLVKLESGLVSAEETLEKTIAANNNQIALNNIQIEAYKKYANYMDDENKDALYLEYREAYAARLVAYDKNMKNYVIYQDAYNTLSTESINDAYNEIYNDEFYRFMNNRSIQIENEDGTKTNYGVWAIAQYFNMSWESENNSHEYDEETPYWGYCGETVTVQYEMTADIRQIEMVAYENMQWRKDNVATWTEAIETKETELADAVTATAAAKKAWDDAAEADKAAKKEAYVTALNTELALKQEIENLQENVEYYNIWITVYEKALDMAKNAEKYNEALQAKVQACNDANKTAYAELLAAWDGWKETQDAFEEAYASYSALSTAYNGANSISNEIKNLEAENEELLAEIEEAQKLLTTYDGYEMPYEVAIEFMNAKIAAQEAVVAAYEVKVKEAKEALDAAMPAEEETPAE